MSEQSTAMKVALMVNHMLLEERRAAATIARTAGFDLVAHMIENQKPPIPSLVNQHCFSCAEGMHCVDCGTPWVGGVCAGLEPPS